MTESHATSPQDQPTQATWVWGLWLLWTLFVIYGSLVPLEFRALPWAQAVERFQAIPFLKLGPESRADWIANGVLYMGVGFLTQSALAAPGSGFLRRLVTAALALAWGGVLATGVEFTQVFFPQRTVSLNDLFAEYTGTALGVAVAWFQGQGLHTLLLQLGNRLHNPTNVLLPAYLAVYLAYSLFPYDLVLSGSELAAKLQGDQWGLLVAGTPNLKSWASALAESLLTVPLGMLWARRSGFTQGPATRSLLAGAALGLVLESAQLLLVSGVTQGLSVLTRAVGVWTGSAIWAHRTRWPLQRWPRFYRLAPRTTWTLYLVGVSWLSGWWGSPLVPWATAMAQWDKVRFVPFYYHYYTTEATALFSVAAVGLIYGGIGGLAWLGQRGAATAATTASLTALVIESGKLFFAQTHPDPTNTLLAPLAAVAANALMHKLALPPTEVHNPRPEPPCGATTLRPLQILLMLGTICGVVIWVAGFPTHPLLLGLGLALYAGLVWWRPALLFVCIPVTLPLLDLAPWSGRLFIDEFDALMAIGLAIGYWRLPAARQTPSTPPLQKTAFALLAASYLLSTGMAMRGVSLPELTPDTHYFSPLNAVRISKGFLWAWLLWPLVRRAQQQGITVVERVRSGMVLGLCGVLAFVLWERAAFAGLLDFNNQYRISGPLSAMHTGGAYIEAYLVLAAAFLLHGITHWTKTWTRLGGLLILALTSYAVMVTYSRGGYAAYALVLVVMSVGLARHAPNKAQRWVALALMPLAVAAALPVFLGNFAQSRFGTMEQDLEMRQSHWTGALSPAHDTWTTALLGEGLGRFPSFKYWGSDPQKRIAQHLVSQDIDGNRYLVLGTGIPVYVDQLINPPALDPLRLQVRIRTQEAGQSLTILLCRKWLLSSYDCQTQVATTSRANTWETSSLLFPPRLMRQDNMVRGTTKISIFSEGKSAVHVDSLSLTDGIGQDWVENGTFSKGLDHWNFTDDNHLAWHVKSLMLGLYFDLGLLGLVAWGLFTLAFGWQGIKRSHSPTGSPLPLAIWTSLFCIGLFDSLIDTPRMLFLVLYLVTLDYQNGLQKTTINTTTTA